MVLGLYPQKNEKHAYCYLFLSIYLTNQLNILQLLFVYKPVAMSIALRFFLSLLRAFKKENYA